MSWDGLSEWWIDEVGSDPAYDAIVTPMALELLGACEGRLVLDVGCGEGRIMRALARAGAAPVGIDVNPDLLSAAASAGPVVRSMLPWLPIAAATFDGAVVVLVVEHLEDHRGLFAELARVLKPGGRAVLVANHPVFTAPRSGPIVDGDGEVLWRPGEYFGIGYTDEPAGGSTIRFHHRSISELLNAAAGAGLALEEAREYSVSAEQVRAIPSLAGQEHIPRLLAVSWRLPTGTERRPPA